MGLCATSAAAHIEAYALLTSEDRVKSKPKSVGSASAMNGVTADFIDDRRWLYAIDLANYPREQQERV